MFGNCHNHDFCRNKSFVKSDISYFIKERKFSNSVETGHCHHIRLLLLQVRVRQNPGGVGRAGAGAVRHLGRRDQPEARDDRGPPQDAERERGVPELAVQRTAAGEGRQGHQSDVHGPQDGARGAEQEGGRAHGLCQRLQRHLSVQHALRRLDTTADQGPRQHPLPVLRRGEEGRDYIYIYIYIYS